MTEETKALRERAEAFGERFRRLREEMGRVIVGQGEIVDGVLVSLFVGGNALLEGVPGLGKTMLVRTLAQVLDLEFSRIQFTPDLMPADIVGTHVIREDGRSNRSLVFQPGPVFSQIVLADEVNRATPKTQSALLEAMQEHSVTAGGETRRMKEPFFVLATQNPLEMEGTYPLPEAQMDRFLVKLSVMPPSRDELAEVLRRTTAGEFPAASKVMDGSTALEWMRFVRDVAVAPPVMDYAVRLTLATHPGHEFATEAAGRWVRYGASPRAAQALLLCGKVRALLDGRYHVAFEDVGAWALPCLRHRVLLNFEAEAEGMTADRVVADVLAATPKSLA